MNLTRKAELLRARSLLSIYYARSGHPGGVLSCLDVILYLFDRGMNYSHENVESLERDRFILSKGHCAPALYAVGADYGFFSENELNGLRKINHPLQGHTCRSTTLWTEASTGSLGQGFSFAIGEAKALKILDKEHSVYVMLGDGELQEGEIWEGAMFASHHNLDNLCAILDYNKMQSDDTNENIMGLEPLKEKWEAFGWKVFEIDGHNFEDIEGAITDYKKNTSTPTLIIAHTIKGKGVSFMEGSPTWHGSVALTDDDLIKSLQDLDAEFLYE